MRIDDITKYTKIIDNQTLYIIDEIHFDLLKTNPTIDGLDIGSKAVINTLQGMINFKTQNSSDFELAFYKLKMGMNKWRWFFCLLYKINNMWQKVFIEKVKCKHCEWNGYIANPTIDDLYLGVTNKYDLLEKAWDLPDMGCPVCKNAFSRKAIWVEKCF